MTNYREARVKLTNTQSNKLRSAAKNKTWTILRINIRIFSDEELLYELFLTARQTTKIRNATANNMSTDIKLSTVQISKITHSDGLFSSWLSNLGKKVITDLPRLASNLASNAINQLERKITGKGAVRAERAFTLFILNEDMNDIKIKK